ncbi:DUF167 family protein [Jiella sp. MQZ9-1]|uniref:UPF0235 protein J1C48_01060 n=1 Tax=Jiella flava TaxID=2816857 RepID=A0A939FTA2_9HYPH|nr:DUF167 family protein [Jiella flava]MBO0661152.1 DUF167 domain-containing protein [Jiella flava]MCD2469798.1 DUF167 family protein [Jiella flava]
MADKPFFQIEGEDVVLFVRVTPRAAKDAVEAVQVDAAGDKRLAVRLRAVPEDGKANKALIALLAKSWGIPKSTITVASGTTQRQKTLRILGGAGLLGARLDALAGAADQD